MRRFTIVETDDLLLEGEKHKDSLFLHAEYTGDKFTKSTYSEFLSIWVDVIEGLQGKGVTEVFSLVPRDSNTMKWQGLFGLSPLVEFEDAILYRRTL